MKNIGIIALKELKSYLTSPMAYIVTGVFLALSGTFFILYLVGREYADTSIRGFVENGSMLLLLFSAVLTMRLVAEEKKMGTWELLLTAPLRDTEVIMGKFLASLGILIGMLALTLYYPILLQVFGDPDWGPIGTSYLGLVLLGSVSLAVGLFASSVTSNQIVAAVLCGGILATLWSIGLAANYTPEALGEIISYISLSDHFPDFIRGIVDTRAIIYYLSVTALFLFLAIRSLETSRWS